MPFIETWDETAPAGSESLSQGDNRIRSFKAAIRERLAVDHHFVANESGDGEVGFHEKVTLLEQASDASPVAGATVFYGKTVSGTIEFFLVLANGTIVQLTTGGKLNGAVFANLANIPAGAGIIPIANLASGTATGAKFIRDDGTLQLPNFQTAATQAEMEAGSSLTVPVTPGRMKYYPGVAKALCNFNGTGTPAMNFAFNFDNTITDSGTGHYVLTLTDDLSSENGVVVGLAGGPATSDATVFSVSGVKPLAAGTVTIRTVQSNGTINDADQVMLAVWGDFA